MIYCWCQPSYIKLIKRVTRDVDKLVLDITSEILSVFNSIFSYYFLKILSFEKKKLLR